ncbi:hypothetical protein NEOLEDRAFT_1135784 [Neolentinus lepideus HHB14362 ss-1]|uniref:GPI anchored protein n=1 Tax=Neolentinus lepideus HHB14362 ss-1 TaxID=1314782 RepID=A0A165RKS5_9AGAM|nr:hypothetical protein NEOLEDRAFT_1135784 [Neolentinus lepideus HHB14362 ss-1]
MILSLLLAGVVAVSVLHAGAQSTSLFIPALAGDGPLSISELGAGTDGRTTWAVAPGASAAQGTEQPGFSGTATLVEGPNDAYLTYALGTVGAAHLSCAISGGDAACQGELVGPGTTSYATMTIPVQPTLVAFAGASTTVGSSASSSSVSSGSSASQSPSQTLSTAPSATATQVSGAASVKQASVGAVGAVAAGYLLCLLY